jgi:hypothetical protein
MAVKRRDPQQVHLEHRQAKRGRDLHPSTTQVSMHSTGL